MYIYIMLGLLSHALICQLSSCPEITFSDCLVNFQAKESCH